MKCRIYRLLAVLLVSGLWLAGCAVPQDGEGAVSPPIDRVAAQTEPVLDPDVKPAEVAALNGEGAIVIVDVREAWEYAEGHIDGAALIPLGTLEDRLDEIPTDTPVVLVCRSGNRSAQAYTYLMRQGFDNVHNMVGGMLAWEAAGLDVER